MSKTTKRPEWQTEETDYLWERTKSAFANDWEQTKADFGVDEARDMDQDVTNTIGQAAGNDGSIENHEQAFRFGCAAQCHYGKDHPEWNETLDKQLASEYDGDYEADLPFIRQAYCYR